MAKFYKLADLISHGDIPLGVPFKCECGEDLICNENLTRIKCSDPNCIIHNSQKFLDMLEILNIKAGIGDVNSEAIVDELELNRPVEIFKPEIVNGKFHCSQYFTPINKLQSKVKEILDEGIEFYKFMNILFLPELGRTRSKVLFSEFSNPTEFYDKFSDNISLTEYVEDKLNIAAYNKTVTIIVDNLINKKSEILDISKWFKFKESFGETYFITITGDIVFVRDENNNSFKPRDKFAEYLSRRFNKNIQVVGFSVNKTNLLVMDSDMRSNSKYKKATEHNIPVYTSKELVEKFEKEEKEENENNENVDLVWGE